MIVVVISQIHSTAPITYKWMSNRQSAAEQWQYIQQDGAAIYNGGKQSIIIPQQYILAVVSGETEADML
ncbi:hypothetical protein, partial [Staphylococcus aureus]|uniref:hypothetical protein n=1 Tax=Staphylococcus aureus TaxID=1280 RepID=UPI001E334F7E